jgi:hypothetical protein
MQSDDTDSSDLDRAKKALANLLPEKVIEESIKTTLRINGEQVPFSGLSLKLCFDIFQTHKDKIPEIVELFGLNRGISEYCDFYSSIENADRPALALVPLYELQFAPIVKKFELFDYLLMPDAELYNTTLAVYRALSDDTKKIVRKRLDCIEKKKMVLNHLRLNSIGRLRQLRGKELEQTLPHLPDDSLELISNAQIMAGIHGSFLTVQKLEWMILKWPGLFQGPEEINRLIKKVSAAFLRRIPMDWLPQIDMGSLSEQRIHFLLLCDKENRFNQLSNRQINDVAKKINLCSLRAIPLQHRHRVSIGDLDAFRIPLLYPLNDPESIAIFASYPASEINKALPNLSEDHMHYLSEEQLRGIDTSLCAEKHVKGLFMSGFTGTKWGWGLVQKLKVLTDQQIIGFSRYLTPEYREILRLVKSPEK